VMLLLLVSFCRETGEWDGIIPTVVVVVVVVVVAVEVTGDPLFLRKRPIIPPEDTTQTNPEKTTRMPDEDEEG